MQSGSNTPRKSFNFKGVIITAAVVAAGVVGGAVYLNREKPDAEQVETPKADYKDTLAKAEKGDPAAQNILGELYGEGGQVKQDYAEAAKWFQKAADQGNAKAQFHLAELYDVGRGVKQSDADAAKWYLKAAESGLADAQYTLGNRYSMGRGVDVNPKEAIKWHTKAAEQGDAMSMYNLAERFERGKTVDQDLVEAFKWHTLSAERGFADAAKARENLSRSMTSAQITEAKKRVDEFRAKFPAAKAK